MTMIKWNKMPQGNLILNRKGWYISYNGDIQKTGLGFLNSLPVELFSNYKKSNEETALVVGNGDEFYILNGDFRKEYEKCKSKIAALEFFKSKEEKFGSPWSTNQ